jgi:WD40 repeat protein
MQLHWTSDGASLLVVTFDGVRLVEPGTGRRRMIAFAAGPGASRIVDTAWSPDGSALALASSHSIPAGFASDARVLDLRTGTFRGTLEVINSDDALGQGREVQFENVEWSPDGKLLALIRSNDVVLWDGSSSQPARVLDEDAPDRGTPRAVAFSPDAGVLATTVWLKSEVRFWDPHTGARLFTVPFRAESPVSVAFSPDGTQLAVGTRGREPGLVLLDARTGAVFQTPTGIHEPSAPERLFWGPQGLKIASTQLSAMSPDGNVIADGPDGIRFADTRSGGILKEIPGEGSSIRSLRFSSEGGLLAIARGDRIDLYRVADGATVHVRLIEGPDATAVWVAYTDNGLFAGDPAAFRLLRFRRGSILQPGPLVRADEAGALFRAGLAADLVRGCPLGGE